MFERMAHRYERILALRGVEPPAVLLVDEFRGYDLPADTLREAESRHSALIAEALAAGRRPRTLDIACVRLCQEARRRRCRFCL